MTIACVVIVMILCVVASGLIAAGLCKAASKGEGNY